MHGLSTADNPRIVVTQEDFCMGAVSGAFAAAATTPLDVIKTTMMCTAASRPTMTGAAVAAWKNVRPGSMLCCCILSCCSSQH
jgi:Mitochondrial carrier protein